MKDKTHSKSLEYEYIIMEKLLEIGYPRESIVLEWKVDSHKFVDYVVIDIDTGLPIMMIEMKSYLDRCRESVKRSTYDRLKTYYEKLNAPIKAVGAMLDREKNSLELIDFTEAIKEDDFNRVVNNYNLPPYEILTNGASRKIINQQKDKQKESIDVLKILCWIVLPLICIMLVILDAFDIYKLSALRLIIIGAGAVVTLIPCFKEIKIGEISLINQIGKQKEDKQ